MDKEKYMEWVDAMMSIDTIDLSTKLIKSARKQHACCVCNSPIDIGDSYMRKFSIVEGYPETDKWHTSCKY